MEGAKLVTCRIKELEAGTFVVFQFAVALHLLSLLALVGYAIVSPAMSRATSPHVVFTACDVGLHMYIPGYGPCFVFFAFLSGKDKPGVSWPRGSSQC